MYILRTGMLQHELTVGQRIEDMVEICTGAQIGGVSSWKAFKANMPFLITSLIVLMLVSFCEPITLWIPSLFA